MKNNNTIGALVPFSEKMQASYGLKMAKLIEKEWFPGGNPNQEGCAAYNRSKWIRNKRLLVRGEQSMEHIKSVMDSGLEDREGSLLNLDWRPINIVEKFCNVVSNGIGEQHYRVQVNAVDPLTAKLKKEKENTFKKRMVVKDFNAILKGELGLDLSETGFVPDDLEEMEIYMQMNERPKIEIAEEIILDYIKKANNWSFIEKEKEKIWLM